MAESNSIRGIENIKEEYLCTHFARNETAYVPTREDMEARAKRIHQDRVDNAATLKLQAEQQSRRLGARRSSARVATNPKFREAIDLLEKSRSGVKVNMCDIVECVGTRPPSRSAIGKLKKQMCTCRILIGLSANCYYLPPCHSRSLFLGDILLKREKYPNIFHF